MRRFLAGSMLFGVLCLAAVPAVIAAEADSEADLEGSLLAAEGEQEEATEGHHDGRDYRRPPLTPEWPLFWWSLILFVVFVVVARRFAWEPLIEGLNAREARVNGALAEAKAARGEAEKLLRDYEQRMSAVYDEVREILTRGRRQAEGTRAEIVAAAQQEASEVRDQALAEIESARQEALSQLSEQVKQYAETTAGRLLGRPVTAAS